MLPIVGPSAASCKKKHSTPRHEANTKPTKLNNNYDDLPLCTLWFLGGFVYEDFFAKKTKIETVII